MNLGEYYVDLINMYGGGTKNFAQSFLDNVENNKIWLVNMRPLGGYIYPSKIIVNKVNDDTISCLISVQKLHTPQKEFVYLPFVKAKERGDGTYALSISNTTGKNWDLIVSTLDTAVSGGGGLP